MLESSQTLKTGKCSKLSPRYCGPFTILKRIGKVTYKLALPEGCRVHPVFHVGRLKRKLGDDDNLIGDEVLVELIEPSTLPHEPEKVLDVREKRTRHSIFQECLVKWKDRPEESSTWEMVSKLQRQFPNFVFEDVNIL